MVAQSADVKGAFGKAVAKIVLYIILFVVVSAVTIEFLMKNLLPKTFGLTAVADYIPYVAILLSLAFGYLILGAVASVIYWSLRSRYDHSQAAAVRNVVKIVGIGALMATIAGGVAGGVAGVALGGFLGMVIGFASQQVLGQAIAGLFLLLARPFRIGDAAVLAGEDGTVDDVATLFTVLIKPDGTKVLIPNNATIGAKIYLKPKSM